jgi:hypothetical protein
MTSEIYKLKHFHIENWRDTNLADDLNDGEEFLYTIIRYKDNKEVIFVNTLLKNLNLLDMVKEKVVRMIGCINK